MLLDTWKEFLDLFWGSLSNSDVNKYIALVLTLILLVIIFKKGGRK